MSWVNESKWFDADPDPMIESAEDIVEHMNDDHSDALILYCKAMSKATDTTQAVMTSIDRYGFEMLATLVRGNMLFDWHSRTRWTLLIQRVELVKMVKQARKLLETE